MEKSKKNILILVISIVCIIIFTSLFGLIYFLPTMPLIIVAKIMLNLLNGITALVAMKLTGMNVKFELKNKRQYFIGIGVALILSVVIAFIPAMCGFSLVGSHMDFSIGKLIQDFSFYVFIIGPVEELIFRVYLQDAFVSFFEKNKWIGVILAAFLFGLWHIINGNIVQVVFTFGIGCVFGFSKYKIKGCDYVGLALGHGLYDFLNTVVCMFVV